MTGASILAFAVTPCGAAEAERGNEAISPGS